MSIIGLIPVQIDPIQNVFSYACILEGSAYIFFELFYMSYFTLRSLIHLELIFVLRDRYASTFILLHVAKLNKFYRLCMQVYK